MSNPKSKRLLVNFIIIIVLIVGTTIGIQFAKGYRPNIKDGTIKGNGLLAVTSYPKAARVYINNKLTTVTDDKLYLSPAEYQIKIEKDGFRPWSKTMPIKPELVSSADARLFPLIPATSPLTFYQVRFAQSNPDNTKIVYLLDNTPENADSGLFVYSLNGNQILLGNQNLQIADKSKDWSKATLIWSPDSTQILAVFSETVKKQTKISSAYLLNTRGLNNLKNLPDVSLRLESIIQNWQDKYSKINQPILSLYPKFMADILASQSANVYFSPDKEKVIYSPTTNLTLPNNDIKNTLPNINSTPEVRNLTKGQFYVFDSKEGTNYQIPSAISNPTNSKFLITSAEATPSAVISTLNQLKSQSEPLSTSNITWYGSSRLLINSGNGISIVDYDGLNQTEITSAISNPSFALPTPDGSRLILLTNINQKPDTFNLIQFDLK